VTTSQGSSCVEIDADKLSTDSAYYFNDYNYFQYFDDAEYTWDFDDDADTFLDPRLLDKSVKESTKWIQKVYSHRRKKF